MVNANENTPLPVDRRACVLHRGDEVTCGGSERFIVLGVGIRKSDEVYAVDEDDELVCLSASMCTRVSAFSA